MLVERFGESAQALPVKDDRCVRDPCGLGPGVYVPVDRQGKAVDDVMGAHRPSPARHVVTSVQTDDDLLRSGQPGRIGVAVDLAIGNDDQEVDVTPVVRVPATERATNPAAQTSGSALSWSIARRSHASRIARRRGAGGTSERLFIASATSDLPGGSAMVGSGGGQLEVPDDQ
jgi:hypothetical protein